ncbi:leukotoxin LktA family filamentous adhesin [Parvularcula marina]|uniref:Leukotoxin LktA family filamentous adhesin n=1 Tax=Parvularcula marina TaxID=2292771 RepID=A0A371RL15_9PROT|nr:leukotoxin LktA family filamentous adhesin [Parvularcula marina]
MSIMNTSEPRRLPGVRKYLLASSASLSLVCGMGYAQAINQQGADILMVPNPGHAAPPVQQNAVKAKKAPPAVAPDRVVTNLQTPVTPPSTSNIQAVSGSDTTVSEMVSGEFVITTTELNAAGTTAFNRFTDFTLASGDSADLYLPGNATTLLNIVRDSRVFIDGTLTSILSDGTGNLGGHLIFASPDGVIVGANGVLNVGALTLVTPTTDYLDTNFTAGAISSGAITDLARGSVPLTASGLIQVTGTIYAPDGIVLAAPEISIFDGGALWAGSQLYDSGSGDFGNAAFEATVQTAGGISVGTALVENNGAIEIVASTEEEFTGNLGSLVAGERPVAESVISIDGAIWGDGINVTATAKASSTFDQSANLLPGVNLADYPFAAGVVEATAIADIVIGANADLQSTADVDLSASTEAEATLMTANSNSDLPFSIGVSVADLVASAEVVIQAGASVMAADKLSVSAKNKTKLDNNASSAGSTIPITAAFSFANVDAAAVIESGANIDADTVNVTALNQNSFKTSAEAETGDDGTAAIAFAFADTESDTLAFVGADIGSNGSPISAVTVEASSITTENRISASSTQMSAPSAMGTDMDAGSEAALSQEIADMSDMAAGMSDSAGNQLEGVGGTNLKIGATTTINFSSQSSRAVIEGGTYASAANGTDVGTITTDPANAPMIYADDVAIYSETLDNLIRNFAISDGSAEVDSGGSSVVITAAIALGFYDYTTEAEVGEDTQITAQRVGVGAFSAKKFGFTLIDSLTPGSSIDGIYTYLEDLSSRLSASDFGLAEDLFTSYAAASSSASGGNSDTAIAGNISYQEIHQDTRAWVDSGARITATGSAAGQAFTTDLSSIDDGMGGETARSFDWWLPSSGEDQPGVVITAKSMTEGVHVAGAINFFGASLSSDGNAIGGSVNIVQQETSTIAGVADGAVITTDRALTIKAETNNFLIGITPTSGEGSGVTGVGLVSVINIENTTIASVSNLARVEALAVNIDSNQFMTAWSVAAAKASAEGTAIGLAGAVNIIATDTQAFIGDNSAYDKDPGTPTGPTGPYPGNNNLPNNQVIAQNLRVRARTSGESGTLAVAGSQSSRNMPMGGDAGMMDISRNTMSSGDTMDLIDNMEDTEDRSQSSVDSSDPNERDVTGVLDDATGDLTDQSGDSPLSSGGGGSQQPRFGFAISGSASVSLNELITKAYVDGANVTGTTGASPTGLLVEAVTDTDQISLSGAAALSSSSGSSASGAISGAVAYQVSENQNDAGIYNATVLDMNDVDVRALTGGLKVGAALGLSAETGSSQNSAAVAGSFSIARVADSADARIRGSVFTLTNSAAQTDMVNVDAYNRNTIGIGAGSVAYGGRASAAGGLTYAEIDNRDGDAADGSGLAAFAGILDTEITDYDDVSVAAINAAQTIGVGVVGSATTQNFAIAGAIVINRIDADALARIGEGSVITVDDDLTVAAGGGEIAAFDAIIAGERIGGREANEYDVGVNDLVFDSNGDTPDSFGTGARAFALAGAVSVGKTSAGFAIAINDIDSDRTAIIDGDTTSVTAGGNVDVIADNESEILALSIATAAGTDSGAFTGSLTVNFIEDETIARIGDTIDSGMMQTTVSGSTVDVIARGNAQINALSGGISISAGNAAIGASISVNEIGGSIDAGIIDTEINDASSLNVIATTSDESDPGAPGAEINSIAIAGGVSSGGLALSGSATANLIETNVMARIENSTTDNETGLFANVAADRYARIQSIAGALGASGGSGVGIGVGVNRIKGTVSSRVTGGSLTLNTLTVTSVARDVIRTIGVGLGGGGSIGAAGSVVVNLMSTDVTSAIGGGAIVITRNNVGVNALADSEIEALAGAAAFGGSGGVGVASAVNIIDGETTAKITGASTQVTAKALDPAETLTVRDGTLLNPLTFNQVTIPVIDVTIRAKSGAAFDENTKQVRGLSVNATALRETDVIATAISIGGYVGAALNAGVNVISGTTRAQITDATINPIAQGDATARAGDVDVKASTHVYGGAYSIGVAGSGGVGVAGAGIGDSYETETFALIDGATVTADDVLINSVSSYTTANVIAAAGAGIGGVAAGGIVTIFDATTVGQLIGGTTTSNSLGVNAEMDAFVGGFGLVLAGGGLAAAGTFNVLVNESDTEALIGRRNTATEPAEVTTVNSDDVDVTADTTTIVDTTGASGAVGGGIGIAGTASVIVSETNTRARIENAAVTGGAGSSTNVQATDNFSTSASTASASFGGVGAGGASVNVVVAKSKTNASVDNSTITTGALTVDADGVTDIDTNTYALAVGGSAGISGAISVIKLGGNLDADASSEISGTLTTAEMTANESSDTGDNNVLDASEQAMLSSNGSYDVDGETLNSDTHLVAANVTGSTVNATTLSVTSDAMTGTHAMLGGAAAGGLAGIGAAIGFTTIDTGVSAGIDSGSTINAGGAVTVTAESGDNGRDAAEIDAIVGAAGLGVGLGAAVANVEVTSDVLANVSGRINGANGGALTVTARDTTHADADASGVSLGLLGAAGVVVARAEKIGSATATIGHATNDITGMLGANVGAEAAGGASANAQGASGGIGISVQGTIATASESTAVTASVRDAATIALMGALNVSASSKPDVYANARGVSVAGGAGVGVSLATARIGSAATPSLVQASIGNNVNLMNVLGGVNVDSSMTRSGRSAEAYATGSAGGLLLGAQASKAKVETNANVYALVGDGVTLPIGGLSVIAGKSTSQIADSSGKSGGFVSVGAADSEAISRGETIARVGSDFIYTDFVTGNGNDYAMPTFKVNSGTSEVNEAVSESGSGGVIAGAATTSTITSTATTKTQIGQPGGNAGSDRIKARNVDIQSLHLSNFRELADASSAGLAGKSGASTNVNIANSSVIDIADGFKISGGTIRILANSETTRTGDPVSVKGGAGGLGAFASADGNVRISQLSDVSIGDNADIKTLDIFNFSADNSDIKIDARSSMNVDDIVVQRASGGLAVPTSSMEFDATITDSVSIGDGASLDADGGIYIGVSPSADINARAASKSSAGIGVTDARATAGNIQNDIVINQSITVGQNAKLSAERDVRLNTGGNGFGGTPASIEVDITSDSYNSALIPASTSASAVLNFTNNAGITIDTGAIVESIRDVIITASRGDIDLFAEAVATFKINLLLGVITQTDRSGTVVDNGEGTVTINGTVEAGFLAERRFDIDVNGNVTVTNEEEDRPHVSTRNGFNPLDEVNARIAALQAMIDAGDTSAAGELAILQELARFLQGDTGGSVDPDTSTGTVTTSIPTFDGDPNDPNVNLTRPDDVNGAIEISGVTAASGNVEIFADALNGNGALTANGGPIIAITNQSGRDLIVGDLDIFDASIGEVRLTGMAQSFGNLSVTENRKGERSVIIIDNSPASFAVDNTSDLYITGDIINLFGLVDIDVKNGDLLQTAVVGAGDLRIDVPNGGYFAILPDGLIPLGPDPRARFEQYIILENLLFLRDNTAAFDNFGDPNYDPNVDSLVRLIAQIPFLLGEDTTDGLPNIRDENDFAAFMTHYLANPLGLTGDTALTDLLASGQINTDGVDDRLGNRGAPIDTFLNGTTFEDVPTVLALYYWETFGGYHGDLLNGAPFRTGFDGDVALTTAPLQLDMNRSFLFGDNTVINKTRAQVDAILARRGEFSTDPRFSNRLQDLGGVIDVAGVVGISAQSIDIGGTVVSGRSGNRNLQLTAQDAQTLQFWIDNPASRPQPANGDPSLPPNLIDISSLIDTIGGDPREKITAVYDLNSQQIIVENVNASGGGHIILNGQILSTTGDGQLLVRNGRGQVVIDNQTGFDIQINDIDAGRDTRGIIQITDTAKIQPNGNALTTFYVQEAGKDIEVYQTDQVGADYTTLSLSQSVAGNFSTYTPKEGIAFEYFEERFLMRELTSVDDPNDDEFGFQIFGSGNWVWADSDPRFGQRVTTVASDAPYFQQALSGEIGNSWRINFYENGNARFSLLVPQSYRLRRTQTIRADNPVTIGFQGSATGSISVTSASDISIAGTLNNPTGTVLVNSTNGSVLQAGNGRILATMADLRATGAIGDIADRLDLFISSGGDVSATGGSDIGLQLFGEDEIDIVNVSTSAGDIDVTANSTALNISSVISTGGNVSLVNTGHLFQPNPAGTAVSGQDISLTSLGGRIFGLGDTPFRIDSSIGAPDATNAAVTLSANGDIIAEETVGTLRLSEVRSTTGGVTLISLDGDITNAFNSAEVDENQVERINAAIDALLLRTDDGSDNILGFENRVANQYGVLARIRERASVDGAGMVSLSAVQAQQFAAQYAASIGDPLPGDPVAYAAANFAAITAFVQAQYDEAFTFLTTGITQLTDVDGSMLDASGDILLTVTGTRLVDVLDVNGMVIGQQTQVTTLTDVTLAQALSGTLFPDGMLQSVTADVVDGSGLNMLLIAGVTFTQSELDNQIPASAVADALAGINPGDTLISTPSTQVFNLDSTIFADTVSLITGGSVGGSFTPIVIEFTTGTNPNLDPFTRALLATASPGDITVEFDEGANLTRFIISPANPLFVDTSRVDTNADGDVFVGSNTFLTIGSIIAGMNGDARIYGRDGIQAAADVPGGTPSITANDLLIESADGAIGAADRPLEIALSGALSRAGSNLGVYLRELNGDFNIGNIFSNGDIHLYAPFGGILSSIDNENVHIEGQNIRFESSEEIGELGRAIGIRSNNGTVIAIADGGAVNLRSPLTELMLDRVTATGDVDIVSAGDLTILDTVSAGGALLLGATTGDVVGTAGSVVESTAGSGNIEGENVLFDVASLLSIFGDLTVTATTGQITLGEVTTVGTLSGSSVTSTQLQNDVTAGSDTVFTAGTLFSVDPAVNVSSGGLFSASGEEILLEDDVMLMAQDQLDLSASNGDVTLGNNVVVQSKAGSSTITGNNLIFAMNSLVDIFGDLVLSATAGQTVLGQASVGGTLTSNSSTDTLFTNLVMVGGDASFTAGGNFTMQPGTSLISDTGMIDVEAMAIMMGQGSQMTAAGPISLQSLTGDVIISQLTSMFDGEGAIDIMSAGSILPVFPGETNLTATAPGALVRLMAEGDIGSIDEDRPIVIDVTSIEAVSNNGDIYFVGLSDLNAPLISAANGAIKLRINGSLTFGEIIGEPDIEIMGSLTGDRMVFRNGVLVASEGINIGLLEVGESLTLRGTDIMANILHTEATSDPLNLILTGFDPDTEASTVLLDIDAPLGLLSPTYYARNSVITTTANRVMIEDGLVTGDLILRTPSVDLVLDNASQVPRNMFDIQLYNIQPRFFLMQDGFSTVTDEFILFYLPGFLDTQQTPLAFDAISIRRNQQLAPGSALWGDSYRMVIRYRDDTRTEQEKAEEAKRSKPVTTPDDGYTVNVSAEFNMVE